jgi:hypothetical protein
MRSDAGIITELESSSIDLRLTLLQVDLDTLDTLDFLRWIRLLRLEQASEQANGS